MGFFSELKSDLSQAVNTLMPDDKPEPAPYVNRKVEEEPKQADIGSMLERLDSINLDDVEEDNVIEDDSFSVMSERDEVKETSKSFGEETMKPVGFEDKSPAFNIVEPSYEEPKPSFVKETREPERAVVSPAREEKEKELEYKIEEQTEAEITSQEPKNALEAINNDNVERYVAETIAETETPRNGGRSYMEFEQQAPTDEIATITEGMIIKGDLATTGSIDLIGKVNGNIMCLGKLNVTGEITGNSEAAEVYAESARITGEVKSKGSVKVGQSTVIIGNIFGSSAVIAGAVKGDIDVHGPVVLDTTAIVMGNVKSQSVQINNGAVIEGMCSQAYADVNPAEFFDGLKNK